MVLEFGDSLARPMQHLTDAHIAAIDCYQYGNMDEEGRVKRPDPKCVFRPHVIGQVTGSPIIFPPIRPHDGVNRKIGAKGDRQDHRPWPFDRKYDQGNDFPQEKNGVEGSIVSQAVLVLIGRADIVSKPIKAVKGVPVEGTDYQYELMPGFKRKWWQDFYISKANISKVYPFCPTVSQIKPFSSWNFIFFRRCALQVENVDKGVVKSYRKSPFDGKNFAFTIDFDVEEPFANQSSSSNQCQIRVAIDVDFQLPPVAKQSFELCSSHISPARPSCTGEPFFQYGALKLIDSAANIWMTTKITIKSKLAEVFWCATPGKIMEPDRNHFRSNRAEDRLSKRYRVLGGIPIGYFFLKQLGRLVKGRVHKNPLFAVISSLAVVLSIKSSPWEVGLYRGLKL